MGAYVTITGPDGEFQAYVATPNRPNGRALVVIQEIFGVNKVMRDLADVYAEQGYLAVVPDLFWRIQPGIDITDQTPEEWQKAFDYFGKFNVDTGIVDIQATIDYLQKTHQKVGAVGYCLGGLLAYLTATRTSITASVSYYGVGIQDRLAEVGPQTKPLLLHVASEDSFVNKDAQAAMKTGLSGQDHIHLYVYDGLDHAFARIGGQHYDAAGAALAHQRTIAFFDEHLS
ncbi:carboxymethylenebutenolidase [Candidatus Phycosocius bacilliformis]|uniref:Carboxymethylenebutenolidase n=1 Tax=Candidatus Phycosocius bacilliformis TaxID=1445552 RepID=A0A2P2E7B1_9PROT|nr:dienelactone hydrolase family protein [Candidatus Phycosocius bacilliformis]GBF56949.1 carboxymethylenebutenolidase [Candidatus Phycosocius bacilliformis]